MFVQAAHLPAGVGGTTSVVTIGGQRRLVTRVSLRDLLSACPVRRRAGRGRHVVRPCPLRPGWARMARARRPRLPDTVGPLCVRGTGWCGRWRGAGFKLAGGQSSPPACSNRDLSSVADRIVPSAGQRLRSYAG
jgi:hypothetical protein